MIIIDLVNLDWDKSSRNESILYGGGCQKSWECQDSSDNALHIDLGPPSENRVRACPRNINAYLPRVRIDRLLILILDFTDFLYGGRYKKLCDKILTLLSVVYYRTFYTDLYIGSLIRLRV